MHYLIVSFTHKNTNINTREKLAFNNDLEKNIFLKDILDCNYINGAILTSTCNRVEIVSSVIDIQNAIVFILKALNKKSQVNFQELEDIVDIYEDENAVRHIFTVVSSLDSLVVGETQIAGQFKNAYKFSKDKNFVNQNLTRLVNFSFKCAKQVRNITSLGTGSVSVASAAVAKAKDIFQNQINTKALVIGSGEMSELTIRHLLREQFSVILVSRNIKKAQLLASSIIESNSLYNSSMIEVYPYDDLQLFLNKISLLFTATSAPYPIITEDIIEYKDFDRYWFDIAIPRDIDNINIPNIYLYAVDDLKDIVNKNLNIRATQAKEAYSIISTQTKEFYKWLGSLGVEPVIKSIYLNANEIIEKKINNAISKNFINNDNKDNITKLCKTIINEFLHTTTSNLRQSSKETNNDRLINTTKLLYGIKELEK